MRISIEAHENLNSSCDHCLGAVLGQHHECSHALEETDDGSPDITLIIRSGGSEQTISLAPEQVELVKTEGWAYIYELLEAAGRGFQGTGEA